MSMKNINSQKVNLNRILEENALTEIEYQKS